MDFKFYKKGKRRKNKETYQDMYYKNYVLLCFIDLFLFHSNLYNINISSPIFQSVERNITKIFKLKILYFKNIDILLFTRDIFSIMFYYSTIHLSRVNK